MVGLGTAINTAAILACGALGLLGRRAVPERFGEAAMQVIGLFTIVVGLRMLWPVEGMLTALVSLAAGGLAGEALRIEDRLSGAGAWLVRRFGAAGDGVRIEGFLAASLLFCVGPMAILGSLADGLKGDYQILAVKSIMDGVAALPLAASMGGGVLLAAIPVLVYQGLMTLGAVFLEPWLRGPVQAGINLVGGFLVAAIGLTVAGIRRFRVANLLPALVFEVVFRLGLARLGIEL
ncbi:MAG: DUF554 domain-containing protein [Patescibacteria group bacterium]